MTKSELVDVLATEREMTKTEASAIVELLFDAEEGVFAKVLKEGGEVKLHGFGIFSTKSWPARTKRNPKSGEAVQLAPSKSVKFRPGSTLKKTIQ